MGKFCLEMGWVGCFGGFILPVVSLKLNFLGQWARCSAGVNKCSGAAEVTTALPLLTCFQSALHSVYRERAVKKWGLWGSNFSATYSPQVRGSSGN